MQFDPQRDSVIRNFKDMIKHYIEENHLTRNNVHIMDESGVYTNQIPCFTYTFKEDYNGFICCDQAPHRDTIVVTLSANGNAHLLYVQHRPKCVLTEGNVRKEIRPCKGVGKEEIYEWAKSFVAYAKPGDLLLLDNLGSYKDPKFLKFLEEHNISYIFFPVRTADFLSVLDNSFFGAFKNGLKKWIFQGPEDKKEKIFERFKEMITGGKVIPFFNHCGYFFAMKLLQTQKIYTI